MDEQTREFIKLVKRMRRYQRAFFETHRRADLIRAKQLERQVDVFIQKTLNSQPEQQTLVL